MESMHQSAEANVSLTPDLPPPEAVLHSPSR
jgi:hypothetical protein